MNQSDLYRTYGITVHRKDLRRWVLRPWWGTATAGIMKVGDAGGGIWRASSREKLIVKMERSLRNMARRDGVANPIIEVRDQCRPSSA